MPPYNNITITSDPAVHDWLKCNHYQLKIYAVLAIMIIQGIFISLLAFEGFLVFVASLFAIFFIIYTLFSVEKVFYFITAYIIIFEEFYFGQHLKGMPIYFSWPIVILLFALLLAYWLIYLLNNRSSLKIKTLDVILIVLLSISLISAVNGLLRGHDGKSWRWDVLPYPFYLSYFIFMLSRLKNKTKFYFDLVFIISLAVAFQAFYTLAHYKGLIILKRIVSQNIHMMQFAIPYAGLSAIFAENRKRRLTFFFLIPMLTISVIISQQRALLFSTLLTLVILFIVFLIKRFRMIQDKRKLRTILIPIILITIVFSSFLIITESATSESFLLTALSRFYVFFNPEVFARDTSWQIRWLEISNALKQIKDNLILGVGLGATSISRPRLMWQITVDNTYAYLLWKMGIIGLIVFLSFHFMVIKRCLRIIKITKLSDEKIFAATIVLNTIGLLIVGMSNVCIAHYRFIFIWAALIAGVEMIARKYD